MRSVGSILSMTLFSIEQRMVLTVAYTPYYTSRILYLDSIRVAWASHCSSLGVHTKTMDAIHGTEVQAPDSHPLVARLSVFVVWRILVLLLSSLLCLQIVFQMPIIIYCVDSLLADLVMCNSVSCPSRLL